MQAKANVRVAEIARWQERLAGDFPTASPATRESLVDWLLKGDFPPSAIADRYQICRCYWGLAPEEMYCQFVRRLLKILIKQQQVRISLANHPNSKQAAIDLVEATVEKLLAGDRFMQQQIYSIARCTQDASLRRALLLATVEEYCLRSKGI
jgi:hypothetical protein